MADVIEGKGVAFIAAGQEPLDGDATMHIINQAETLLRNPHLDPHEYLCPVRFEDENGSLIPRIEPDEAEGLANFLDKVAVVEPVSERLEKTGVAQFVIDAKRWFREIAKNRRPAFIREIEVGRIAIKPEKPE